MDRENFSVDSGVEVDYAYVDEREIERFQFKQRKEKRQKIRKKNPGGIKT